jgi:hypothetical protein
MFYVHFGQQMFARNEIAALAVKARAVQPLANTESIEGKKYWTVFSGWK